MTRPAGLKADGGWPAIRMVAARPAIRIRGFRRRAAPPNADHHEVEVKVAMGETSEMISTSSRESRAKAKHIATSSQLSQVP